LTAQHVSAHKGWNNALAALPSVPSTRIGGHLYDAGYSVITNNASTGQQKPIVALWGHGSFLATTAVTVRLSFSDRPQGCKQSQLALPVVTAERPEA